MAERQLVHPKRRGGELTSSGGRCYSPSFPAPSPALPGLLFVDPVTPPRAPLSYCNPCATPPLTRVRPSPRTRDRKGVPEAPAALGCSVRGVRRARGPATRRALCPPGASQARHERKPESQTWPRAERRGQGRRRGRRPQRPRRKHRRRELGGQRGNSACGQTCGVGREATVRGRRGAVGEQSALLSARQGQMGREGERGGQGPRTLRGSPRAGGGAAAVARGVGGAPEGGRPPRARAGPVGQAAQRKGGPTRLLPRPPMQGGVFEGLGEGGRSMSVFRT